MTDRERLLKAKQAVILKQKVIYRSRDYELEFLPVKLIWHIVDGKEQYSVQLVDPEHKNTTIDVRLQDIIFKE